MQWGVRVWFQIVTSEAECGLESHQVAKEAKELQTGAWQRRCVAC